MKENIIKIPVLDEDEIIEMEINEEMLKEMDRRYKEFEQRQQEARRREREMERYD